MEDQSRVKNTDRNTKMWLRRFDEYRKDFCPDKTILELPITDLLAHLRRFFTGLRRLDGTEYKTKNVHNCFAALNRYLKEHYSPENPLDIMSDPRFLPLHRVIDGKMKVLTSFA
ncbi:hypothetical protein BJV82DRAFT_584621 [Fennellomyces sp. T-0311]|nr:hypothetical protein BJV82DRAFT_584621 [Fennellomyces sp. T-0311]